jgi:hypothetical protein
VPLDGLQVRMVRARQAQSISKAIWP